MSEKGKNITIIFCASIVILFILCIIISIINFFTKDSETIKETIVGINPVSQTKSIMTYQEPLTVILEDKEKELLKQQEETEEILQNVETSMEHQVIKEEIQEYTKIETNIDSEKQEEDGKEETIMESVAEENPILTEYKGFATIGKIEIPKTGVNLPILNQVTVEGMKNAPCLLYATGELNQNGNNLIVGHNFRNGTIFSNNKNLKLGDKIYITTLDGKKVEYTIYDKFITTAEDVSYIKRDTNNKPEITLSCCTDDDEYRIIILAKI